MQPEHKRILAAHAVLAFLAVTLAGLDDLSQPYRISCLVLAMVIPSAQLILLATWSVQGAKVAWQRILLSAVVVALMSLLYVRADLNWYITRQTLRGEPYLPWLQSNLLKQLSQSEAYLGSMMLVGLAARKWLGTISPAAEEPLPGTRRAGTRVQFSLTTALVGLTIGAVFLGLVRGANQAGSVSGPQEAFRYLLTTAVFALLMLVSIWATLSPGPVSLRLAVACAVSLVLGEALSDKVALFGVRAYFSGSTVRYFVTLLTTGLLGGTLLYARKLGYRLQKPSATQTATSLEPKSAASQPTSQPSSP